jgi:hypothetical protein
MPVQFSLFGGEELLAFHRKEEEEERAQLLEEARLQAEQEALARHPSLFDFEEIEKILDQDRCPIRLRCTRSSLQSEKRIAPEVRRSILRSFVTLHSWEALGESFEKIELWLKTPKHCFQNETPEAFSFRCWHCTAKWMRSVLKNKENQTLLLT